MLHKEKMFYAGWNQISSTRHYELQYWSTKWTVSIQQLQDALQATGTNNAEIVREYLLKNKNHQ